jgi:hypothetical protein
MQQDRPLERPAANHRHPVSTVPPSARVERDARELIAFADGLDECGFNEIGRRSRVVARDALRLAEELKAERSTRQAIQEDRDRCLQLLANHAGEAADLGARREHIRSAA